MPDTESPSVRARARRDLADPDHSRRSLRASADRRMAALRRRRLSRAGRSAVAAMAAVLVAGSAGAVAHQSSGDGASESRATASSSFSRGYDVRALQRRLGVSADGVFGRQTRRAVRRFQRRNGLAVDGVVGPATLGALGLGRLTARPSTGRTRPRTAPSRSLQAIAQCESGGDPTAVSPGGRYRGKYQFSRATWRSLGGKGDPAAAPEAEQDRLAALLMRRQGPSAWPSCAR